MNKEEAKKILADKIAEYRCFSYSQLREKINRDKDVFEIVGPSGTKYYVDVIVVWDEKPEGIIRVMGCIDDGGFRAFVPMGGEDFLISPDGKYIGENGG